MPAHAPITQPAPPAEPEHTPPEPIAPTVHRRFTHGERVVSIVEHREVTCCGHVTADARYYAVVGDWNTGYRYTVTRYQHDGRPVRVINWRTTTDGARNLFSRASVHAAVLDARKALHDEDLIATYEELARTDCGRYRYRYSDGEKPGATLTSVSPGEVVAAYWGAGFWRAVVAEITEHGVVRVALCHSTSRPDFTRLLTVGKEVRALHAPPRLRLAEDIENPRA
ncbi:MAG TPA: hypothetical protein VFG15_03195 [Amycolatopsis sp.]|nr:hypothetical protein [Amycolatopsis sp.]